jgi:DNA-binding response OmpR family regulator
MHVILIEPDLIQAELYTAALERAGCSVDHVTGAQAAVHAADEHTPDAVILEMQLAEHSGVEFLYEFRSYPEWTHIPVVLYTFVPSHELAHGVTLQKELGVQRILYKPTTTLLGLCEAVQHVVLPQS